MRIARTLAALTFTMLAALAPVPAAGQTQQLRVAVTTAAENAQFFSAVERELRVWRGTASLKDDVTMLLIERKGSAT